MHHRRHARNRGTTRISTARRGGAPRLFPVRIGTDQSEEALLHMATKVNIHWLHINQTGTTPCVKQYVNLANRRRTK